MILTPLDTSPPIARLDNVGQRFGATGEFDDAPDHRAQSDDDRDMAERLAHAAFDGRYQIARFNPGHQRHDNADQHQRHERLKFVFQDQKQQQRNAGSGDDHEE